MNCFFYICFAILISTVQSLRSRSRLKLGPDLASSADIVSMPSRANPFAIDLDYFGGSSEGVRAQRTSDERSNVEPPQVNSVDRSKPIIVYVSDPKVLQKYQQKLKKGSVGRGSSSESVVSYEDLLKFLIQVGARLKEQQAEVTNPLADQHFNLLDLIRNTRRRTDDAIYESEVDEPAMQAVNFARDASDEPVKIKRRPRKKSVESIYRSPRNKVSIEELPRAIRKRKISNEDLPRVKKFAREARVGSIARIPKFEKPAKRISFIRTPKPFIGKVGIYEDK